MKRYLLFAGDNYYPCGGWEDFIEDFDDLQKARDRGAAEEVADGLGRWWHVVDSETKSVVEA